MFSIQYEPTSKCLDNEDTSNLQDRLTGSLIGIARAADGNEHLISNSTTALVVEALFATSANVHSNNDDFHELLNRASEEKRKMVPDCFLCANPCGRTSNYDMNLLWNAQEDIRNLKCLILFGIRGMAAYVYRAALLGHHDEDVERFFYKALAVIGMDDWGTEDLLPVVMELGKMNLKCMLLLNKAQTDHHSTDKH